MALTLFYYAYPMRAKYIFKNLNPTGLFVGDCAVRACAELLEVSWDKAYLGLVDYGFRMKNLPNSNHVWGAYLYDQGYCKHAIPDHYPERYTVRSFCEDHPRGSFVLMTGEHVICVRDGCYIDTWDSGDECPIAYYYRRI